MLIVAAIFGASYGAIIGFLRGKLGVNEIVVAIMLNWIAYWLVYTLVVGGPWMGIAESQSRPLPTSAWAPMIWEVPFTVFLVLGISVILYFLFLKSKIGYQIRTLGSGPFAAEHAGMSPLKITILVMAVGGALAGLSGYHSWAGHIAFRLIPRPEAHLALGEFTFYGILVGLLCLLNPLTAIPLSIFIGTLRVGSEALVSRLGLPFGLHHVFLGILFLTFVIFQFFYRYKIVWVKKGG
jgi:simple sugar transport system permease protein